MRLFSLFSLLAIACFIPGTVNAQTDAPPPAVATDGNGTPTVAAMIEFAKTSPFRTIIYAELDENAANGGIVGIGIVAQLPDGKTLVRYGEDQQSAFMQAIGTEARASGKSGWRTIRIVADKGVANVTRGLSPGPITGFNARLRAEVGHAFANTPKN